MTRLSYVMSLMPPTILRDLSLEQHGYRVHPMGPYYQAFPEGGALTLHEDDPARSREEIAKFSLKDARAYERWNEWLAGVADVMAPMLLRVPPERTGDLAKEPHAGPFEMRGKAMDGWLRVDPEGVASDDDLRRWVAIGVEHVRTLPPKPPG